MSKPKFYSLPSRNSVVGFLLVVGCLLVSPTFVHAWTPTTPQVFVAAFGGSGSDSATAVVVDSTGHIYTTGSFAGTVDFDPGVGVTSVTSNGGDDVFVSKFDTSGELVWVRTFGGTGADIGTSLALDSARNVYIGGGFRDTVDFDPGVGVVNLAATGSSQDGFVAKLTPLGALEWASHMGGSADDRVRSVAVNSSNQVHATGYFQGTADFDPSAGSTTLTSAGSSDVFVWKLDVSGQLMWAGRQGGASIDNAASLATDSVGDVYLVGQFMGTADFDPSGGVQNMTSSGVQDVFVSKLTAAGNLAWARQLGGSSAEVGGAIHIDAFNNVYTTGSFQGTADFDPNAGVENLTSAGVQDAFLSKLTAAGNFVWARHLGGSAADLGSAIDTDSAHNVLVAGSFQNTVDFDPGVGTSSVTSHGGQDAFVWKLDSSGTFVWASTLGGADTDVGNAITVDATNNVYAAGSFQNAVDFDPSASVASLTSVGSSDVYMWKLNSLGSPTVPTTAGNSAPNPTSPASTDVTSSTVASSPVGGANSVQTSPEFETSSSLPATGSSMKLFALWSILTLSVGTAFGFRVRRLNR